MKGFPNQVADLGKVATAVRVAAALLEDGQNARGDDLFGEALVREGVAGTGRPAQPIDDYLAQQRQKPIGRQSFRTTARGMRELMRAMNLTEETGGTLKLTELGRQAAERPPAELAGEERAFWRAVLLQTAHKDAQGESHPYQMLLRLVAASPGITRATCALALEARDDSPAELDRIVSLAAKPEEAIRAELGVTKSNWDNAKKVLPSFAEQLGDVIKGEGGNLTIAAMPGSALAPVPAAGLQPGLAKPAAPVAAREVTSDTIGKAGMGPGTNLADVLGIDATAMQNTVKQRAARLAAHNRLVREIAAALQGDGVKLYEDPYDILAVFGGQRGLLVEVKSLDGSEADEVRQVRNALSQLLYYEAFARRPRQQEVALIKLAYFEAAPSPEHASWLSAQGIAVLSGKPARAALVALLD